MKIKLHNYWIFFFRNGMSRNPVLHGKGSFKQMWAHLRPSSPGFTALRAGVDSFSWETSLVIFIFRQEVQEFRCESGLAERGQKEQITGYLLTQKCLHCSVSAGVVWVSGWKGTAVCGCKHISHAVHINPQNQQRRNAVTSFWFCYSLVLTVPSCPCTDGCFTQVWSPWLF